MLNTYFLLCPTTVPFFLAMAQCQHRQPTGGTWCTMFGVGDSIPIDRRWGVGTHFPYPQPEPKIKQTTLFDPLWLSNSTTVPTLPFFLAMARRRRRRPAGGIGKVQQHSPHCCTYQPTPAEELELIFHIHGRADGQQWNENANAKGNCVLCGAMRVSSPLWPSLSGSDRQRISRKVNHEVGLRAAGMSKIVMGTSLWLGHNLAP